MVRFPPCTVAESLLGAEKEVTGRKKAGCPWLDGTISAANRMTMALLFLWKMLCLTRIDTAILKGEMWGSFNPDTETLYLYTKSARLLCIGKDEVVAPDTPRSQQRPEASNEPPSDDCRR